VETTCWLVALNFAGDTGAIQTRATIDIELDGQVALRKVPHADVADEGVAMAVLEVCDSDQVAGEPDNRLQAGCKVTRPPNML